MLSLLRLISVRHFFDAKLRTVLTIFGVAVGVATMVGVTAGASTPNNKIGETVARILATRGLVLQTA
jgi:ABC-type antimicrobial peptide transport system permease subunit